MKDNTIKVLYCPFCGGTPTVKADPIFPSKGYYVVCESLSCGCNPSTFVYATKTGAIQMWNKRKKQDFEINMEDDLK